MPEPWCQLQVSSTDLTFRTGHAGPGPCRDAQPGRAPGAPPLYLCRRRPESNSSGKRCHLCSICCGSSFLPAVHAAVAHVACGAKFHVACGAKFDRSRLAQTANEDTQARDLRAQLVDLCLTHARFVLFRYMDTVLPVIASWSADLQARMLVQIMMRMSYMACHLQLELVTQLRIAAEHIDAVRPCRRGVPYVARPCPCTPFPLSRDVVPQLAVLVAWLDSHTERCIVTYDEVKVALPVSFSLPPSVVLPPSVALPPSVVLPPSLAFALAVSDTTRSRGSQWPSAHVVPAAVVGSPILQYSAVRRDTLVGPLCGRRSWRNTGGRLTSVGCCGCIWFSKFSHGIPSAHL